jgi:hypothetical protein
LMIQFGGRTNRPQWLRPRITAAWDRLTAVLPRFPRGRKAEIGTSAAPVAGGRT